MKGVNRKLAAALYVSTILGIQSLVVWNARELILRGYADFTIYYTAGTIVRQGMGERLYDNATQLKVKRDFAPQVATRLGDLPFNHPPFEALLFVPFSFFSYGTAFLLWGLANVAMLAWMPHLVRPYVSALAHWPPWAWTVASFAFFPIFLALLQGQDAILLLFLYVLAFVSFRKGRLLSAGAWLACGLFKFHLVLPFLFLWLIQAKMLRRRMRILCGFGVVGIILGLVSIAVVGARQMIGYPRYVLWLEETMARRAILPSDMPNLRGILYLLASGSQYYGTLVTVFSGLVFFWAAWNSRSEADCTPDGRRDDARDDLKFSFALFTTVLVSYHALGHDLCVLALPVLLLAGQLKSKIIAASWRRPVIIVGLALLLFSPLPLVLVMRYNRLALLGWALLLCFVGMAEELKARPQPA